MAHHDGGTEFWLQQCQPASSLGRASSSLSSLLASFASDCSQRLKQSGNRLSHLLAGSNRDAHQPVASRIARPVAHQHARIAHQPHELRMLARRFRPEQSLRGLASAARRPHQERPRTRRGPRALRPHTNPDIPCLRAWGVSRPAPASSRCTAKAPSAPSASAPPDRPASQAAIQPNHRPLRKSVPPPGWAPFPPGPSPSRQRNGSTLHPPARQPVARAAQAQKLLA